MKIILKATRICRMFLFAFIFAVCMVMGVAPIIPKRKEDFAIEIKVNEEENINSDETFVLFENKN